MPPEDGYFDEAVAARYDESVADMFQPSVVDPTVELLADLARGGAAWSWASARARRSGLGHRAIACQGGEAPLQAGGEDIPFRYAWPSEPT